MDDILIGTTVGGYQILEEVGRGGMASVYRAHQLSMNRDVAIKVLPPQFLHQSTSLERFKQEASIVARLEHRAIVPVHDYGEHNGIPYIVMRYMDSGSVDDLLTDGPVAPEVTLQILEQIAPALDYAHREGVLHRDLKPSNILLDANGDAYLTDFGIARLLSESPKALTTSGVVGTPSYMSPEQAQGLALDGRSDLYGLGVVLFEMLTGIRPFDGDSPYSIAVKQVTEAPPMPCTINPKLPHSVEPVLLKALAKTSDTRYQTACELATALRAAFEHPDSAPFAETEPSLKDALKASAPWTPIDKSPSIPPPVIIRPVVDSQPVLPEVAYVAPRSYTGHAVPPSGPVMPVRRRKKRSRLPAWLTWATLALLIGGLLLALTLGGVYFALNTETSKGSGENSTTVNYEATAILKMTQTRQAIFETEEATPVDITLPPPPTNTPRPTE